MSKKVLIISSSPRKGGNSDTLCDKFMEGAKSAGNEVEKVICIESSPRRRPYPQNQKWLLTFPAPNLLIDFFEKI